MKKYLFIFSTLIGVAVTFAAPRPVSAESDGSQLSFSVAPAIFEVVAEPGKTTEASLTFANNSDQPAAAVVEAESLIPVDNLVDQLRRGEFDAASWIELEQENLVFEANAHQEVNFTIDVPELANPGNHYAVITLKPGLIEKIG